MQKIVADQSVCETENHVKKFRKEIKYFFVMHRQNLIN